MKCNIQTITAMTVLSLSISMSAEAAPSSTQAQIRALASEFIASMSCENPRDAAMGIIAIVHLDKTPATRKSAGEDTWAVVYTAGMEDGGTHFMSSCQGGNGNAPTEIAIVRKRDYDAGYYVDPTRSFPVVRFHEPIALVRGVMSYVPNSLTLTGDNYGPHDNQADPSLPAKATMIVDAAGNWSVVKPLN